MEKEIKIFIIDNRKIKYYIDNNFCYNAIGRVLDKKDGYPIIRFKNKNYKIARFVYMILVLGVEELNSNIIVRHKCDNRLCFNPEHLIHGSFADNSNDMTTRGRSAVGQKNGSSKLIENDVNLIRELYRLGLYNQYQLAEMFEVSRPNITDIINLRTWTHI